MAGIEPAPIKELGPLLFQDLRIGENAAIGAKDATRDHQQHGLAAAQCVPHVPADRLLH
jgi:hypothetical protein